MSEERTLQQAQSHILRVVDVETSGYKETTPEDLLELGWCDLIWNGNGFNVMPPRSILVYPVRPITNEGRSVHHIEDVDLVNAVSRAEALTIFTDLPRPLAYVAHNKEYEQIVLPELNENRWICTFKSASVLFPDFERHTNQFLRYELGVQCDKNLAQPPHRAGPDAYVTAHNLIKMFQQPGVNFQRLLDISAQPHVAPRVPFTKYRGKKWSDPEITDNYLTWVANTVDMSEGVRMAAAQEIERRREARLSITQPQQPAVESHNEATVQDPKTMPTPQNDKGTPKAAEQALRGVGRAPSIFV